MNAERAQSEGCLASLLTTYAYIALLGTHLWRFWAVAALLSLASMTAGRTHEGAAGTVAR